MVICFLDAFYFGKTLYDKILQLKRKREAYRNHLR